MGGKIDSCERENRCIAQIQMQPFEHLRSISIYVSLCALYSFLASVNYSIKVESSVAYLENIIIIIKVKDHYSDWKLYRHFWQFANCEMKEEEDFRCRCVTVRKLAVNLFQALFSELLVLPCKCKNHTSGFPVHPRNRKKAIVKKTLVPERSKHSQQATEFSTERQTCHNLCN